MSLDVIIDNIINHAIKAVECHQGMITLVDEISPSSMFTLVRAADSSSTHKQFHLNQNILGWMIINKKPLVSDNFPTDERFASVQIDGSIKSLLCVPLLVKNRLIGILALFDKKGNGSFTNDDVRLLSIMATQSAQVLENARLYEQERKKIAMEKELIAAREVQMNLLPRELPKVPGFQLAATTIPAKEVGGDFYDIIKIQDNIFEIIIADVAGKGLPAALLATLGKGVLCSQALQHTSLLTQLNFSNHILRGSVPHNSFITLLLATINTSSKTITIANAGHCYPLFFNTKTMRADSIPVKGLALNLTDDYRSEVNSFKMNSNDCLILYSDGVSEAQNISQEFFGTERLAAIMERSIEKDAATILKNILDEIKIFTKGVAQFDDITILVMKATG